MAAIQLQTILSFYAKKFRKKSFFSASVYENCMVCKHYCIAHHDDKTCFLPACKYHNILLVEIEEPLHKLDTICFSYQHVDCLYTLSSCRFNEKILRRVEMCLTMCREQSPLTKETEEWTKCRVLERRGSWEKSLHNVLWVLSKRKNQRGPVVQCLKKELKKPKRLNLNWI